MKKMTFLQWGMLAKINEMGESVPLSLLKDKRMVESCIKKGYLEIGKDGFVIITDHGREVAARDIVPLEREKTVLL